MSDRTILWLGLAVLLIASVVFRIHWNERRTRLREAVLDALSEGPAHAAEIRARVGKRGIAIGMDGVFDSLLELQHAGLVTCSVGEGGQQRDMYSLTGEGADWIEARLRKGGGS